MRRLSIWLTGNSVTNGETIPGPSDSITVTVGTFATFDGILGVSTGTSGVALWRSRWAQRRFVPLGTGAGRLSRKRAAGGSVTQIACGCGQQEAIVLWL